MFEHVCRGIIEYSPYMGIFQVIFQLMHMSWLSPTIILSLLNTYRLAEYHDSNYLINAYKSAQNHIKVFFVQVNAHKLAKLHYHIKLIQYTQVG
jgi:hypothetical protein